MKEKLLELLNSLRFWQITTATGFLILGHYFPGQEFLWTSLAGWLTAVTAIGTFDSIASRVAGTKVDPPVE